MASSRRTWLSGFLIPAEYGGQNFSASEYTVAIETIAEYDPMAAYSINEHSTIGSLGLVKFGTEAQKKKYLPLLASGKLVAAFGLSEPEHGSDVTSITTSAVKKGNKYVLSGKNSSEPGRQSRSVHSPPR